ncbi:hypothetical protein [Achromobacter insuavis]|uniref:hypothetical protein n=1 Tax=Achromobacter insuavis TaxID=1287735 RepID=UPI001EEC8D53|nr:hypothetical protein [Achromobacter insuavis]
MTTSNNTTQAADKEIQEEFERRYAMDADDPASAIELGHFANGWRAAVTKLRAPITDLRPHLEWALRRIRTSLDTGDKYEAAQAALDAAVAAPMASAPVADEQRALFALKHIGTWAGVGAGMKTHKEVREYAKHNAQACTPAADMGNPMSIPPVVDERAPVAYLDLGAGGYMDMDTALTDEQLAALPKGRHMLAIIGTHGVNGYTPAALASAPAADERHAVDPCGYVAVKRSAVDWLKDKFPALTIKAGLCERIGGRLYTITRLMRDHDAALASAPVAGEAKNYPGENVAERLDNMADDQPPGSQAQSDLYAAATIWRKHIAHRAAPQASEAVRTQVLAALESAQRFIRNGIEFGYIRMPDADTPDPAHRTPSLIDAAIRSLKSQADKDGGQQRAGDGKEPR